MLFTQQLKNSKKGSLKLINLMRTLLPKEEPEDESEGMEEANLKI